MQDQRHPYPRILLCACVFVGMRAFLWFHHVRALEQFPFVIQRLRVRSMPNTGPHLSVGPLVFTYEYMC